MIGYIFKAENTVTKKIYIGKYLSVRFDKKYVGNDPGVLEDVKTYGADKFIVNMLKACETVKDCEMAYDAFIKAYNAKNDINYYNCEKKEEKKTTPKPKKEEKKVVEEAPAVEEKPKKSRKKKVEE